MNHATHAVDEDRDRHEEASSERNDLLHPLGANARIHRDTEEFSASDDTEF
ncbi:MAG UNVERIFIED_CONTAM: hypothetical protein LVQ98_05175 [Rickettsiaceae bacterium]|jgi:hypothetical protein